MKKINKIKIIQVICTILVVFIVIGLCIYLFPLFKNISTYEGQIALKNKIQNSGITGLMLLTIMQMLQIFLMIIPGEPIEILAGACYGGFWGTVFIMVTACITTTIILIMVKKFGKSFIHNFCDKEKINKIEKSKLFQNEKKIEIIVFILFLIPGTPKDLLVYIGGLLPIKPSRFIIISTFARLPSIVSSTIAGGNIIDGNWQRGVFIYLILVTIVLFAVFIINIFDKEKITENALKEIR